MSCGVMYQSHYSYFPYQRNIIDKQNVPDHEVQMGGVGVRSLDGDGSVRPLEVGGGVRPLEGGGGHRDSPNQYTSFTPSRHTSPLSFPSQGGLGLQGTGGFPPPLHRNPETSPETGFQHNPRDSSRTGSETGFQQPQPPVNSSQRTHDLLDKVKGEKDKDGEECERSAHYLSANCVIFTYYSGDISRALDDHFSKALSQSTDRESIPLTARNLPASFWDCNWAPAPLPPASTELYSDYGDPWQSYMASMTGYSAHQMYTARSYSSLLLQSRRDWVEQNYPSSPYPAMSGLEGGGWF